MDQDQVQRLIRATVAEVLREQRHSTPVVSKKLRATILAALTESSMTQSEITTTLFCGNLVHPEPTATLIAMHEAGLIDRISERPASGRGRTITRWSITSRGRIWHETEQINTRRMSRSG